jgi:hypothetical protein
MKVHLWVVAMVVFASSQAPVPARPGGLPKEIAALMPEGATGVTGTWQAAGTLSMGDVRAEVRGTSTCDGRPGAGTISLELMNQTQPALLPIYEPAWRQKGVEAKASLTRDAGERRQAPLNVSVGEVKEETVAGGTLVYFQYTEGCVQSPKPNHTTASLRAVVQRGGVFTSLTIVLPGTATEARALAAGILANVQKTDFNQLTGR